MSQLQLITTQDGAHTLWMPEINETYHSTHGAIQESQHVFVQQGLMHFLSKEQPQNKINVLEVGLGTGLNVLLTYLAWIKSPLQLSYTGLEPYPVSWEYIKRLNYAVQLTQTKHHDITYQMLQETFEKIHQKEITSYCNLSEHFSLYKYKQPLEAFLAPSHTFDIVYFDAFSPSKQPAMWTANVLQQVYHMMKPRGIIVTYCAQGKFKHHLRALGMCVETISGPPGKREMTRAQKKAYI